MKRVCIFGGQYGSEGKGAAAEFIIKSEFGTMPIVFGENGPNSGHTCSAGKTRQIPASSYFARAVILGPDSAIDPVQLELDLIAVRKVNPDLVVYIHEHAALITQTHRVLEQGVVESVSSTGSGNGAARVTRNFHRAENAVMRAYGEPLPAGVHVFNRFQYLAKLAEVETYPWLFECSQGVLLDNQWGIYPFVTSRNTLPRVAIERNGLTGYDWTYLGVYRTFPIRTGGPSGPTGGDEIDPESLGIKPEIATVTGRTRRMFNFCPNDFALSLMIARPSGIMFTHGDYLLPDWEKIGIKSACENFMQWLDDETMVGRNDKPISVSFKPGEFHFVNP